MRILRVKSIGVVATLAFVALGFARMGYAVTTDATLISEARQTVEKYRKADPAIDSFFQNAAGYVVFPGIGKGGLGVGAAHGTGVLFENGTPLGKVTMNQVSVGLQAGGQHFSEIVFYETPKALAEVKAGKAELAGSLSAVALTSGAAKNARFNHGVAVFTATIGGLMFEASVGGQKFDYAPF
jgi:lipid-binding SYLF domain-containing protein